MPEREETPKSMQEDPFGACRGLRNGCLLILAGITVLSGIGWLVAWLLHR